MPKNLTGKPEPWKGPSRTAILTAALAYASTRGWHIFSVPPGTKKSYKSKEHSAGRAWGMTNDAEQIRADWKRWPQANIGLPTGAVNGIFVVETDTLVGHAVDGEAALRELEAAHEALPETLTAESPTGSRHYYFRHPGNGLKVKNSASEIGPGVDVRGEGGMVVAPPSIRADGAYRWLNDLPIADAPGWLIELVKRKPRSARRSATTEVEAHPIKIVAALEAIPNPDLGWDAWNAIGMATWRASGGSEAGFSAFDVFSRKSSKYDADTTAERWQHYASSPPEQIGFGTLAHMANQADRDWLRKLDKRMEQELSRANAVGESTAEAESGPKSPERKEQFALRIIQVVSGQRYRAADETEDVLIAANRPVFVRAGKLVEPIWTEYLTSNGRKTKATVLRPLGLRNLAYMIGKHAAVYHKYDRHSERLTVVDPPNEVVATLLELGHWGFPHVAGLVNCPTLRPDGTLLHQPGYDAATQLWCAPDDDLVLPSISNKPSRADAETALQLLIDLVSGFPFVSDLDRSVALAAILAAVLRGSFDVVPMTVFLAHDRGTGKSFLVDLISTIIRGRPCPVIAASRDEAEMEKRLGALILESAPIISLDNMSFDLGSDLLCQMTTQQIIKVRILGKSETPECEWRGLLFATGNNVHLTGDMTRRGLPCNLDAKVERPELRSFAFDPIARVLNDRGAYVAAAITIARAYRAAGSPSHNATRPLGSYGAWSSTVREPLIWLRQPDPAQGMDQARREDPERRATRELIEHWHAYIGVGRSVTTNQIVKLATDQDPGRSYAWVRPEFHDLLVLRAGTLAGNIDPRRVGNWIMKINGQVHDDYRIDLERESASHGNRYVLTDLDKNRAALRAGGVGAAQPTMAGGLGSDDEPF
jgi:putative DNA primase/helicase